MMEKKNIIETFNLTKKYTLGKVNKSILALNDVSINIKEGEKFGLLGPNGAGKTTLVSILATLMQPTSGYAIIDGYDIRKEPLKIRNKIVLMLSNDMIYYRITGYDNLKFFCKIYQIKNYKEKIYEIAKQFKLEKWLHELVEKYSTGMKIKLSLCRTFLLDAKIFFLDEPTLGLDVKTQNFLVSKIKEFDKTIFLTSHNMNVVEKLCDRIAFINDGKIEYIGDKEYLGKLVQSQIEINIDIDNKRQELINELNGQNFILEIDEYNEGINIKLDKRKNYSELISILKNYNVQKITENESSVEDLFLKLI